MRSSLNDEIHGLVNRWTSIIILNWLFILQGTASQGTSTGLMSIVPAYFAASSSTGVPLCTSGLGGSFSTLAGTRPERVIGIINPASGPALAATDVTLCWQKLSATGVSKLLGYVATGYGANNFTFNFPDGSRINRTLPVVLQNIDTYYTAYKCNASVRLDGIFLDELATWYTLGKQAATPATQLAFYTQVVNRIRQWDQKLFVRSVIVGNSGGKFLPSLLTLDIDWIVGFEGPTSTWTNPDYHGVCPPPNFSKPVNPSNNQYCGGQGFTQYCPAGTPTNCYCPGYVKIAAMVYNLNATGYPALISQVKSSTRYEAVYTTDKTLPNPYLQISSYFSGQMLLL
eukprot:jgi/Botrbrau1/3013/Bobra.0070s0011.1